MKSVGWISQKGNDPYYRLAKRLGQPSRAYFKLFELDRKYRLLGFGAKVIDLGSAPGGWVGYELKKVGSKGRVVAVDLRDLMITHPRLIFIKRDVFELKPQELLEALGDWADALLSDLAPNFTGIRSVDMARQIELANRALELALETLEPKGWFVVKLFMSPEATEMFRGLRNIFEWVKLEKPSSSRPSSSEVYAVCRGLRSQHPNAASLQGNEDL